MNVSEIVRAMEDEGGITLCATVRKCIFRWSSGRGQQDKHRCGARSKITMDIAANLERKLEEDDEVTSVELQRLIARFCSRDQLIRRYIRKI